MIMKCKRCAIVMYFICVCFTMPGGRNGPQSTWFYVTSFYICLMCFDNKDD